MKIPLKLPQLVQYKRFAELSSAWLTLENPWVLQEAEGWLQRAFVAQGSIPPGTMQLFLQIALQNSGFLETALSEERNWEIKRGKGYIYRCGEHPGTGFCCVLCSLKSSVDWTLLHLTASAQSGVPCCIKWVLQVQGREEDQLSRLCQQLSSFISMPLSQHTDKGLYHNWRHLFQHLSCNKCKIWWARLNVIIVTKCF